MNSINWSVPNIWVFTAKLVEHCSANAEAMRWNPVEALKTFFRLKFAITTAMITSQFCNVVSTGTNISEIQLSLYFMICVRFTWYNFDKMYTCQHFSYVGLCKFQCPYLRLNKC